MVSRVAALLQELRGAPQPPELADGEEVFAQLVESPELGAVFIASVSHDDVGLITLSVSPAIRAGGSYVHVEELWVSREGRSRGVGAALITRAEAWCAERGHSALEVGLPPESFSGSQRTQQFYRRLGFRLIGDRVRKVVYER